METTTDPDSDLDGPALAALQQGAGAWLWDTQRNLLFADPRFANLCGLDAAAALRGLPTEAFFSGVQPDDLLRVRIAVAGVMHGAELLARDYRVKGSDEMIRWVSARGRAERDDSGQLTRFSGLLVDITEQKRVEEQLRIAQTAGGVGTFEHVDGFGTAMVSAQFCRLLGLYPTDSLPVRTINAVVDPGEPPLIRPQSVGQGDDGAYSEVLIHRADTGEERWIARRGEHRSDGVGHGARFIGVIYDITASKHAQAQLVELARTLEERVEERTRERDRVWNRSRDLFAIVSQDGVYQAVNPAWTSVLGHRPEAMIGISRGDLIHPDDRAATDVGFRRLLDGKSVENFDCRVRGADGGYRWINWTVIPEDGAMYAIGRDVTERKHLEEQLRQSQKMEAVGQLTGGLAHDFNNMLTGVIGGLDLARRRMRDGRHEDAFQFMDAAVASAERAAALTHRLLAFSRRQTLDPQTLDINRLIGSMTDLLRRTLGEQVELAFVGPEDLWLTRTDANQLESAILNLAINARDAMADGGRLSLRTANVSLDREYIDRRPEARHGDYVLIQVDDTGAGMPASVVAKAFDPFFTTKPIGQGTGLGLSMVYGFVRQSGGHVEIDSEPGRGTSVRLYLPRVEGETEAVAPIASDGQVPRGDGETVLVVEDDAQVRLLVMNVLQEMGYQAIEAIDSQAALAVLETGRHIDLLISDVGLPGLNGRQLAEMARKRLPELPVLFVTGYAANATVRSEFLGEGMRMIAKPFPFDALAITLREMLDKRT
ncbi:MAG: PAS domain-containing protein [Phenylobacterium sp.]|uniref:hybrid sensor histidine kinase/response regulator n=1 Tax=Phenylobacterium sp. TaxID=1871053 RepID=UPI0027347332|nr:PAS domain-containing protein [Phenylobacterium sp.]MDP3173220.1 PAS domain-containing protein [Phenylobacterium sp.]